MIKLILKCGMCLLVAGSLLAGGTFLNDRNFFGGGKIDYSSVGLQIRPVYQFDYTDIVCFAAGEYKSVATSGCGATCMAMVIEYLTGRTDQTPQTLFEDAYANGDYIGYGLSHEALDRLAEAYGVQGRWIGRDADALERALQEGYPVIAHMGPGVFAEEGHYILLRGLTEDGRVVMNDPNSKANTSGAFRLDLILQEAKTDYPFMICTQAAG